VAVIGRWTEEQKKEESQKEVFLFPFLFISEVIFDEQEEKRSQSQGEFIRRGGA